jgi:hypothetical protein
VVAGVFYVCLEEMLKSKIVRKQNRWMPHSGNRGISHEESASAERKRKTTELPEK